MTTLDNSYCVPKTAEEWRLLGVSPHSFGGNLDSVIYDDGQTRGRLLSKIRDCYSEIPVQHFLDLFHDRIAPWRLHEIGFKFDGTKNELICENGIIHVGYWMCDVWCNIYPASIKKMVGISMSVETFTDLLTLIKFLTPLTK